MATKSTKKTKSVETTSTSSFESSTRSGSPLSPTRTSRLEEKSQLQDLNSRLAAYIERVQQLEKENSTLTRQITTYEESTTHEITGLRTMYENELNQARSSLDTIAKERAKLEIDFTQISEQNATLKNKLNKTKNDLSTSERKLAAAEGEVKDLQSKYNQAAAENKEAKGLLKQLEDARKHLAEETLLRVDLENRVQSLKEDLEFKKNLIDKQEVESRRRRQVEITEIDGRLSEEYEAKLQTSLDDLRDEYEARMQANRQEIEQLYDNKIRNLQAQCENQSTYMEEVRNLRIEAARTGELERLLEAHKKALAEERERHQNEIRRLEHQLDVQRAEIAQQLREYQDLLDIKVALDIEISAYRKLLESEEQRLHLTPSRRSLAESFGTPRSGLGVGGGKRKRVEEAELKITRSCSGDIEIVESDENGKCIKLTNKSDKEVSLGGWTLTKKAHNLETSYRFHRTVKLDGKQSLTVWSADQGITHEPPHNLVMKNQRWCTGSATTITLTNSAGKEMAQMNVSSETSSYSSRGFAFSSRSLRGQGDFGQQGDQAQDERCSLM